MLTTLQYFDKIIIEIDINPNYLIFKNKIKIKRSVLNDRINQSIKINIQGRKYRDIKQVQKIRTTTISKRSSHINQSSIQQRYDNRPNHKSLRLQQSLQGNATKARYD